MAVVSLHVVCASLCTSMVEPVVRMSVIVVVVHMYVVTAAYAVAVAVHVLTW